MDPTARSLILDLLSTLRRGTMPVGALVEAGGLFGLSGNAIRVALARGLAAGRIERDERGRYRLGGAAAPVASRVQGWRRDGARTRRWSGAWLAVHSPDAPRRGRALRERERALRLLGFAGFASGLWIRPDNLGVALPALRTGLAELGLEAGARVFRMQALDADEEARARGLWDVESLGAGYRGSRILLEESEARLPGLDEGHAMAESFRVGGRVIRQLVLDPQLPDEILPGDERAALTAALARYDRAGRACWARFLGRFDVPHRFAPADTRVEPALA